MPVVGLRAGVIGVVPADAGVVPVGDVDRAIGGDAHVIRPEPLVLSFDQLFEVGPVASAIGLTHILVAVVVEKPFGNVLAGVGEVGANDIRTGVGVNQCAAILVPEEITLIGDDAARRP